LEDEASITELGTSMGIADAYKRISEPRIKEQLKVNTDEAIAAGVFGVPTFVAGGTLFWGDDATDMFLNYLRDPSLFEDGEMLRISSLPMGITRPR
jgi:2-hydroxychromene-2-carboxylate isomerase